MLGIFKKDNSEKQAMSADEIRELRENERIDSIYIEESHTQKVLKEVAVYVVTAIGTAVLIAMFFAFRSLTSFLCANAYPFLWMVDDSSGFLVEMMTKLLELALAAVIAIIFGSFVKINFDPFGRDSEEWAKPVKICLAIAFGTDVLFLLKSRIMGEAQSVVNGDLMAQIPYYVTKLLLVPITNVMLYVVVASAVIRSILTLIADSRSQIELPLTISASIMLTLGQLGMSMSGIMSAGFFIIVYAAIQSTVCSVIYHKTDVIWAPVLTYIGTTALYYLLSWLLYLI